MFGKRLIISCLICLAGGAFSVPVFGQNDSLLKDTLVPMPFGDCPPGNPYFYHMCGYKFGKRARTLGIMPEYQFGNSAVSLGLSHGYFEGGEWGGMGKGITANIGFLTRRNAYMASLGAWYYKYFIGAGPLLGARSITYWNTKGNTTFVLRPEIGLFLFLVQLKYGYDIRLNKDQIGLRHKHNFTVSFYLPVYP